MKKFAGTIHNWNKTQIDVKFLMGYPENLGFIVFGQLGVDHKNRGFDFRPIRTSLVVKEYTEEDSGKHYVETLNSIYELGEAYLGDSGW